MNRISASLLTMDLANLESSARRCLAVGCDWLHIDMMDGHFVPNISYGPPVLKCLKKAIPNAFYDAHLMFSEPQRYVKAVADAGADLITFHAEALHDALDVRDTIARIHAAGCKAGLAINPATPVDTVVPFWDALDIVLVMSVEPGFGGQPFLPDTTEKLMKLREMRRLRHVESVLLEVDGGIDAKTGERCLHAGADVLVIGSGLFRPTDPVTFVKKLQAAG